MVEFINPGNEKIVGTRVTGQIDPQDFDQIKAVVSERIKKINKVSWYYEMIDFEEWELSSFWRDVVFSLMNTEHFEKIAFVGENTPPTIMAEVTKVFTPAEVKYFELSDKDKALDWIK